MFISKERPRDTHVQRCDGQVCCDLEVTSHEYHVLKRKPRVGLMVNERLDCNFPKYDDGIKVEVPKTLLSLTKVERQGFKCV